MKRGFSQNVFFEENKLPWVICTLTCECTGIATTYNIGVLGGRLFFRYIIQIHQLWHHIHQKDVVSNGWINKYAFNCRKLGESNISNKVRKREVMFPCMQKTGGVRYSLSFIHLFHPTFI